MTKICSKCKIEKDIVEFHKHPTGRGGLKSWCKSCEAVRASAYYKTPAGQLSNRNSRYKCLYGKGMSVGKYNEMFTEQNGLCAICGKPETMVDVRSGKVKELALDHHHITGHIRGLLCNKCNTTLGHWEFVEENWDKNKLKQYLENRGCPCG